MYCSGSFFIQRKAKSFPPVVDEKRTNFLTILFVLMTQECGHSLVRTVVKNSVAKIIWRSTHGLMSEQPLYLVVEVQQGWVPQGDPYCSSPPPTTRWVLPTICTVLAPSLLLLRTIYCDHSLCPHSIYSAMQNDQTSYLLGNSLSHCKFHTLYTEDVYIYTNE